MNFNPFHTDHCPLCQQPLLLGGPEFLNPTYKCIRGHYICTNVLSDDGYQFVFSQVIMPKFSIIYYNHPDETYVFDKSSTSRGCLFKVKQLMPIPWDKDLEYIEQKIKSLIIFS